MIEILKGISATQWLGYLAAAVVMGSFVIKNILQLRMINFIGCMLFLIYGVLNNFDMPIIITNGFIVVVNTVFILKHFFKK